MRMMDPSQLTYSDANGTLAAELEIDGCAARVIKYAVGERIPMHYHTKTNIKFLLRGAIAFEGPDGPLGVLNEGEIYWCGAPGSPYRGAVLKESYLLIVEESGSERVNSK